MSYEEFITRKHRIAPRCGFDPDEVHGSLFDFQALLVRWAIRRGRAAMFCGTGLGKTIMQLDWADRVAAKEDGRVLILAPLAVAQQTVAEGERFDIASTYLRQDDRNTRIVVTNYEMLERFNPSDFCGVVLDESSILKAFDGRTRTRIIEAFADTPYRLACTATPAPNDYMELGNHSEFLGVMSRAEMLAQYFVHDGGETQQWRLKGHAREIFWKWVCSWAAMVRMPSDLGFVDGSFRLPELEREIHEIKTEVKDAWGMGELFPIEARTLNEQRKVRRATMDRRVEICADLVNESDQPWLVWCELNDESAALRRAIPDAVEVKGSDDRETKVDRLVGFASGKYRVLITKPSIAGFGMNWQHCARMVFCGVSHSWEQYYQAVRRCWRFGQRRPVEVHLVVSDQDGRIIRNLDRKEEDGQRMAEQMAAHMFDEMNKEVRSVSRELDSYEAEHEPQMPDWFPAQGMKTIASENSEWYSMHQGDCVDTLKAVPDESVHYSIFSPPFASLYTYSNSERDMGNCPNHEIFREHLGHLIPSILRVTKPGRLMSMHCMDLPTSKSHDGFIGISDFRGMLIREALRAGWIFHSTVVIWKDPVTAMQRTKALGLLHKQLKKDSCMSRQGIPDYVVTFRKPGENAEPVVHSNDSFPVSEWQKYASPIWDDINPSDTLQFRSAREHDDERHICPLQLTVIRRCLDLWTNPGDVVLSPFAGIGSEGYVAIENGRRFVGVELKGSYYKQACNNLAKVLPNASGRQMALFAS